MQRLYDIGTKVTSALPAAFSLALLLAACQFPDFSQISMPRFDASTLIAPNVGQYVPTDRTAARVDPGDLVDAGGQCANAPASNAASEARPARAVGLKMTECEVVRIAGSPESVQIGTAENGERSVVMVYAAAERPIYRFVAGRLVSIERGAEPPPEPEKKKPAAKKPAKKPQAT